MNVQIEESWKQHLAPEFEKDYFVRLTNFVRQEYANFLRKFLYSIDHIDWRVNRSAQMTKLLCHLEKRHGSWPKDVEEEQKQVELAIDRFEKEEISEMDFGRKLVGIMKSLE